MTSCGMTSLGQFHKVRTRIPAAATEKRLSMAERMCSRWLQDHQPQGSQPKRTTMEIFMKCRGFRVRGMDNARHQGCTNTVQHNGAKHGRHDAVDLPGHSKPTAVSNGSSITTLCKSSSAITFPFSLSLASTWLSGNCIVYKSASTCLGVDDTLMFATVLHMLPEAKTAVRAKHGHRC